MALFFIWFLCKKSQTLRYTHHTPLPPPSPKSHFWMNSSLILSHSLHLTHTRTHTQFLSHSISHFESYYLLCLYLNLTRLEVLLSISVQFLSLDLPLSNSLSKFLSLFLSNLHTHSLSLCHILSLSGNLFHCFSQSSQQSHGPHNIKQILRRCQYEQLTSDQLKNKWKLIHKKYSSHKL